MPDTSPTSGSLRHKLIARVGLLIGGFVIGAVVAVWLLQGVLGEVERANRDAAVLIDGFQAVGASIASIEARTDLDRAVAGLEEAMTRIGSHEIARPGGRAAEAYERVHGLIPAFVASHRADGAGPDDDEAAVSLRLAVADLGRQLRSHVAARQSETGRDFRTLVVWLTIAALIMVNVAVVVLVRAASMVLKPVGELVEGSRELALEHFDHRVRVDQSDEFAELAHAYNRLAERLQASEERKTETLRQLAVTLNHDLNNAMSIIELQLGMVARQAGPSPGLQGHLREIRTCLAHMTGTVSSLKHIRRVVLTDYVPGQKMVDLERSVLGEEPAHGEDAAKAGQA